MKKKCVMCGDEAIYIIKDTADAYCQGCASDCFSDTSFLQRVEDAAQELKKIIREDIDESE